jgi:methyl-accepting chemotaxis protein
MNRVQYRKDKEDKDMHISNLKIGPRLGLGFAVVLALMLALVGIGINSMGQIQGKLDNIVDSNVHEMELLQDMTGAIHVVRRVMGTLIILTDHAAIDAEYKKMEAARARYNAADELLRKGRADEAEAALRTKLSEIQAQARPLNNQVVELARANDDAKALELLLKEAGPATQKWQDLLDDYVTLQKESNKKDAAAAQQAFSSARLFMFGVTAVALAMGMLLAWLVTRSITGPINLAVQVAQTVAAGDLTSQIDASAKDETGHLLLALKDMNTSLQDIVGQVRSGTDTIATASSQISSGNLDLSSRTEQQASSLEETASAVEQLTSTVKQNGDNARQANQMAASASDVALKGGSIVAQVVETMGSINESSRKIVDIIGVIDGIAFQTNILALNAAVEAARAGEQGRGFAVVATEVRNLAQRSAGAAKEIKELIGDSVDKVEAGSRLVNEAGATMDEIVASVKRVTDIMGEITAASHEQELGIDQIHQSITEMDGVTQQNAALVEEAAAAAASLHEQADTLANVVSVFKLDGTHMQMAPGARTAAPAARRIGATVAPIGKRAKPASPGKPAPVRLAPAAKAGNDEWEEF